MAKINIGSSSSGKHGRETTVTTKAETDKMVEKEDPTLLPKEYLDIFFPRTPPPPVSMAGGFKEVMNI